MKKEKEIFHSYLKSCGLKTTCQRDLILEVFLGIERHITVEELYKTVRKHNKNIGFSTVYRTIKILTECGLASRLRTSDGNVVFEHKFDHKHHDHLICDGCGKILEFFNENIEAIQKNIAEQHDFEMTGHVLKIFGRCRDCRSGK